MRYPASEKLEIIRLVEQSHLPVCRTLETLVAGFLASARPTTADPAVPPYSDSTKLEAFRELLAESIDEGHRIGDLRPAGEELDRVFERESLPPMLEVTTLQPGDTVVVNVKVKEGNRERVQAYEGVVIAIKNAGINSAFTVRKISHGVGVERVFQPHSAIIDSVTVKRRGAVRAGKLYYLRDLQGKKARIKEDLSARASAE